MRPAIAILTSALLAVALAWAFHLQGISAFLVGVPLGVGGALAGGDWDRRQNQ